MSESSITTINAACDAFHLAVVKFIQRQKKKLGSEVCGHLSFCNLESHALYLASHAAHVLEQLHTKRQALESAIEAWDECSNTCIQVIQSLCSSSPVPKMKILSEPVLLRETLQHWFTQYLRLRDGFVLLTNGECRHSTDSLEARKAKENGYCSQKMVKLLREIKDHPMTTYRSSIASSFSFPSQLDVEPASTRKDGYTKLFKSKNGYSGYGWDDLFHDEVGIRHRLLLLMYQMTIFPKAMVDNISIGKLNTTLDRIWEEGLIEKGGAQAFDMALDEHETKIQFLKRTFEERCNSFIEQVNTIFTSYPSIDGLADGTSLHSQSRSSNQTKSGKLVMTKEDKFERLELKEAHTFGFSELIIQRQGDAFKVTDKFGVLPSHMNKAAWTQSMKLPNSLLSSVTSLDYSNNKKATVHKKIRRIIDEDSDHDEHGKLNKDISSLKVVIVEAPTSTQTSHKLDESIGDIKKQFGVDSIGLEQSREALEAEENQSTIVATFEKGCGNSKPKDSINTLSDDIHEIQDMVMDERERVEMLKNVLKRATDLDEIWDAHESLRESLMFLGNRLLSLHDMLLERCDSAILSEAVTCFQSSITIVNRLRKMVDRCFKGDSKDHIDFINRTLILCHGRALTNLGRTFLEQSKARLHNKSAKQINDAVNCLNDAVSCAKALRAQCICLPKSNDEKYLFLNKIHKFEADELEVMALRWLGLCLWQTGLKDQGLDNIHKSIGELDKDVIVPSTAVARPEGNLLHSYLKYQLEQYYGSSSLVNLTTKEVDIALLSQDNLDYYQGLVEMAARGYKRAAEISDSLYGAAQSRADCPMQVNDLIHEHDIVSSQVLREMRDNFVNMWKDKVQKSHSSKNALNNDKRNEAARAFPRGDIYQNGFMPSNKNITIKPEKFIVDDIGREFKAKRQTKASKAITYERTDDAFDGFGRDTRSKKSDGHQNNNSQDTITYRLWGDEVLIAMGKDIHQYPSCCPVRPTVYSD